MLLGEHPLTDVEKAASAHGERSPNLRDATLKSVRWIGYGRVAAEVIAFLTLVVLAHLISPAQYGRVAIALVLQSLAWGLTNEGFGSPIVQRQEVNEAHLRSAALMSVAFGAVLAAFCVLVAPFITTRLYGVGTTHLVQLAAIMFPIYSFAIVPEAILMRRLDMRTIAIVETTGTFVGSILSVVLAVLGLGGTAIVLGAICSALVTVLMLIVAVGLPRLGWHTKEAREITRYGIPASGAGLAYLGVGNVDNVLIGARLGAVQLGLYYRAFALGVSNQMKIGLILMRVAFPAYSRSTGIEEMRRMRARMTRLNFTVILPLLVLLAVGAPKLVPFLFGAHWKHAVVPTQILAFAGMASCLTHCAFPFLLAAGHPKVVLRLMVGTLAVYAGAIVLALPYGLHAVCYVVVAANIASMVATYVVLARVTGVPVRSAWHDTAPALISGAVLGSITFPLMHVLSRTHLPAWIVLAGLGGVGITSYVLMLGAFFRDTLNDAVMVGRGVLFRRPAGPARNAPEPPPVHVSAPLATSAAGE